MKTTKKIICMILAFVMIASLAACGSAKTTEAPAAAPAEAAPAEAAPAEAAPAEEKWDFSDAPSVNLTFAIYVTETDPMCKKMCRFLDTVKEYTEGTVDYTLYAGQTLCNGKEEVEAVRNGLCDITFFPISYGSGLMPLGYIVDYPGIEYASQKSLAYTIKEYFEELQPEEIADLHLVFAYGQTGGVYATNQPIRTFEDFQGKQIRCSGSMIPVMEAYGAIPTTMVVGEAYEAIRTGIVNGYYGMATAVYGYKMQEVTQYVLPDPLFHGSFQLLMNNDVWESLTPDQQDAINTAAEEAFAEYICLGLDAETEEAMQGFVDAGLEIVEFDDENMAKMVAASAPILEEYAASVEGGTEALALLRQLAEKNNEIYPAE